MPLDPQVEAYMTQMAALNVPPLNTFTPEAIRQLIQMQIDSGASQFGEPEPATYASAEDEVFFAEIGHGLSLPLVDPPASVARSQRRNLALITGGSL